MFSLSVATRSVPPIPPGNPVRAYLFLSITRTQVVGVELIQAVAPFASLPLTFIPLFGPTGPLPSPSKEYDGLAFVATADAPIASAAFGQIELRFHYYGDPPHAPDQPGLVWVDATDKVLLSNGQKLQSSLPWDSDYLKTLALTPREALSRRKEMIDKASVDPKVDLRILSTMRLFHRMEELTFPDPEVLGDQEAVDSLNRVAGYLEERLKCRAMCYPHPPRERIPGVLEPPDKEDFDVAEQRLRHSFLDVLGSVIAPSLLDDIVFRFVLGDARPLELTPPDKREPSDFRLEVMGAPNGAYFFLFAEAGMAFLEHGYTAGEFWRNVTRCFAWTIPVFSDIYWDRESRRMSSYAFAHRRRPPFTARPGLFARHRAIPLDADKDALAHAVGDHVKTMLSQTFHRDPSSIRKSCLSCESVSPDSATPAPDSQRSEDPLMTNKNFMVRFARFDGNGKVADGYGPSGYKKCADAIKASLLQMGNFKPIGGNTPAVYHQVAVAICGAVRTRLKDHPYPGAGEPAAEIHDTLPVPSKLNPKGGWDPLSRSVFFPVVVPEESPGPQEPSFFVGIEIIP